MTSHATMSLALGDAKVVVDDATFQSFEVSRADPCLPNDLRFDKTCV